MRSSGRAFWNSSHTSRVCKNSFLLVVRPVSMRRMTAAARTRRIRSRTRLGARHTFRAAQPPMWWFNRTAEQESCPDCLL